jgi:hypothetical protein
MNLWTYVWFQKLITWCRKWKWFDTYVYGRSINLEDFVRNPFEVMCETYFPFIIKGVKAYSVFNLRLGYIPYNPAQPIPNCRIVPMGDRKLIWKIGKWIIADLRVWNPWFTKFCNSIFFLQLAVSLWHYIPIPYVSLCIKIAPWYFQFGLGWGADTNNNAILSAKFRFVNEKTSDEAVLNYCDVLGYYEGTN